MKFISLIICVFIFSGCDLLDAVKATKGMPEKIDQTNDKIKKTNESVRLQKLMLAKEDMLKPENTKYLAPPTGMLAGGQAFADAATPLEMVKLTYVWLLEVEKGLPDNISTLSDQEMAALIHEKLVKLMAIQVIAALTAQDKIDAIIEEQITKGGRYEDAAYSFLMSRALLIKSFLLEESLLAPGQKLDNPGKLHEASSRVAQLEYLMDLGLGARIQLKISVPQIGLEIEENLSQWNRSDISLMRERVEKARELELDPKYK